MTKIECIETLNLPSKILLKMAALHVTKLTKIAAVRIVLNYFFLNGILTLCILNVINAIKANNSSQAFWHSGLIIPVATLIAKNMTLFFNKSALLVVFHHLQSDIFNEHSEKLNCHIQLIDRLSKYLLHYFMIAASIIVVAFGVLPLIFKVQTLIPAPFHTGRFELVYNLFQLLSVCYMVINSVCLDIFNMTLMALAIAQFNILHEQLSNIVGDVKYPHRGTRGSQRKPTVQHILKKCLLLYEAINLYVQKVNILLAFPLSIQYLSGCFALCNAIVQITILNLPRNELLRNIVSYYGVFFAQMAAYHWLANEIMHKSDRVTEACYLSEWYELDISSQRTLLLLMERAKRPFLLRLYSLIPISLESLGVIIRWSYSIFALVKARYS